MENEKGRNGRHQIVASATDHSTNGEMVPLVRETTEKEPHARAATSTKRLRTERFKKLHACRMKKVVNQVQLVGWCHGTTHCRRSSVGCGRPPE